MIKIKDREFDGAVVHTPNERIKGFDRATVTITTSELTVDQALELFQDGSEWGIVSDEVYYDWSNFDVAGRVADNRDGTVSIVMGKLLGDDLIGLLDVNTMTRNDMNMFSEKVVKVRETLEDDVASTVVELFKTLKYDGKLIKMGTRINWNGVLKRAAVDLWDTEENNPDNAIDLWEDILYRDGYRFIPETITVGTAFSKGECGWWKDELYESLLDNNVWTPAQHPSGWKKH